MKFPFLRVFDLLENNGVHVYHLVLVFGAEDALTSIQQILPADSKNSSRHHSSKA